MIHTRLTTAKAFVQCVSIDLGRQLRDQRRLGTVVVFAINYVD